LAPPPEPPSEPTVSYDEKAITLSWAPFAAGDGPDAVLPSTLLGAPQRSLGYNVYEGTARLTKTAVADPTFADSRLAWGEKRCYVVRTAEKVDEAVVESAASPEVCVTPVDTFPPAAPKTLQSVASVGAITLIWEPNAERDLAGYIVLRGGSESDLEPMMASPITATQFKDDLGPGTRHVYAVLAVDRAGNASALSNLVEDTAR
jgi:fibronectin type 3 domain-containing protein